MKFKQGLILFFLCFGSTYSRSQTLPPAPDLTENCTGTVLSYPTNYISNIVISGNPVIASFSNINDVQLFPVIIPTSLSCGIVPPPLSGYSMGVNNILSTMTIHFDKRVSNVKVYILGMASPGENVTFTFKDGCHTVSPVITQVPGDCSNEYIINANTGAISHANIFQNDATVVNFGGIWFDEITITKPAPAPGTQQWGGILLTFCIGATNNIPGPAPDSSTVFLSRCPNQLPTTWNGITIPAGSTSNPAFTTYTTTNAAGCDSTVTLNLSVNPNITSTASLSLCSSQLPASWNGITIPIGSTSNPAFASYTTTNAVGCDSTVTLNLTVNPNVTSTASLSLCASQLPASWNGIAIPAGTTSNPAFATYTITSAAGCDSTVTLSLTVNPNVTSTASLSLCASQLPASWNGIAIPDGTTSDPAFTTYTTTSAAGCDSTVTLSLTVNPNVTSTASLSLCASQLPASWNGINIPAGTASNPAFTTYTTTNAAGCDSVVTLNLTVTENVASTASLNLCTNELPASWNGIAIPAGATSNPAFTTYTTTNAAGCDSTVTLNLTVIPAETSTETATICDGQSYTFGTQTLTASGTYTQTFTTANTCDSIVTLILNVSALPIISLQQKETDHYCLGDTATLMASGADIYQWWWRGDGNASLGGGTTKAVPIYTNNQLVVVQGSDNYGCTDTAEIIIKAQSCCQLLVPNAFSPNGDGLNDDFGPKTDGNPRGYAMHIYNRWGQMIYVSNKIEQKWNGTQNGQPAELGTYHYLITGECANGEQIKMKGDIILLR